MTQKTSNQIEQQKARLTLAENEIEMLVDLVASLSKQLKATPIRDKSMKYLITGYDGDSEMVLTIWKSDHDRVMKELETHYPGCDWTVTEIA